MESASDRDDAVGDLAAIDEARRDFAGGLVVPPGYDLVAGTASGLNMAAVGLVVVGEPTEVIAGVVLFVVATAGLVWAVRRFRAANGAWVSGLRRGRTLRVTLPGAAIQAILGFAAAAGSIAQGWWWLGLVLAPVQVVVFIVTSRLWMTVYRAEHGVGA